MSIFYIQFKRLACIMMEICTGIILELACFVLIPSFSHSLWSGHSGSEETICTIVFRMSMLEVKDSDKLKRMEANSWNILDSASVFGFASSYQRSSTGVRLPTGISDAMLCSHTNSSSVNSMKTALQKSLIRQYSVSNVKHCERKQLNG